MATTASTRAQEYVAQFGADRVINYNDSNWWELGGELSLTAIVDTVGGDAELLAHAKAVLPAGTGCLSSIISFDIGFDSTAHPPLKHAAAFVLSRSASIQDRLAEMLAAGSLLVPINATFPFTNEGVADMYTTQGEGKSLGKNVLNVWG